MTPDFDFSNHGSICLLTPRSAAAHDWTVEHIPEDSLRWGQCSIVIEPRYVQNILDAIEDEGMVVQ